MNTLSVTLPTTLSTLRMPYRALRTCTLLACAMAAAGASWAQGTVLMQGPHAQVTTADIQANLAVLPPERQNQILQSPDTLRAMVENIYLRRATAARAEGARSATRSRPAAPSTMSPSTRARSCAARWN